MQCATLIFHTCVKYHLVMSECEEVNFAGHTNILSEYVKFLAHNSQLEVVARIEKWIQEFKDSAKLEKKKDAAKAKQLNTATQKVNNCVSKLAAIETRLARLEKKWKSYAGNANESKGVSIACHASYSDSNLNSLGGNGLLRDSSALQSFSIPRRKIIIYILFEEIPFWLTAMSPFLCQSLTFVQFTSKDRLHWVLD